MKFSIRHALLAVALVSLAHVAEAGTIVGSAHDFTAAGTPGGTAWSQGQICLPCHAPHNNLNATGTLLWNHADTASVYTLYNSPTMNSATIQPSGVSKLCLSCHDGTVALDSFGGAAGTTNMPVGNANFGTTLGNDHPISITYDAALVTSDGALRATATAATIGSGAQMKTGTINTVLLNGGKVECSSCHDVHNTFTVASPATGLLKMTTNASAICLACHIK